MPATCATSAQSNGGRIAILRAALAGTILSRAKLLLPTHPFIAPFAFLCRNLKALRAYFREGGEEKAVAKDARRRAFYSTGSADSAAAVSATAPATTDRDAPAAKRSKPGRIVVLDVGASYNPLGRYSDELDVTALDLAPAAEEVLCADFTQATFTDETLPAPTVTSENGVPGSIVLQRRKYDAVVFNLLLSYLPTPELRFACV